MADDQEQQQVSLTPATPEELLDAAWDRLGVPHPASGGNEIRYIGRDQLAEFMTEAALLAMGASSLTEPALTGRPVPALLQSLKVMGDQAGSEGRPGWTIICQRAARFIEQIGKDVTRFLEWPDLRVQHMSVDTDLRVEAARVQEDGHVLCTVVASDGSSRVFKLADLHAAGPMDDFIRVAVSGVSNVVIMEAISAWQAERGADMPEVQPLAHMRQDNDGALVLCAKSDPGAAPVFGQFPATTDVAATVATALAKDKVQAARDDLSPGP